MPQWWSHNNYLFRERESERIKDQSHLDEKQRLADKPAKMWGPTQPVKFLRITWTGVTRGSPTTVSNKLLAFPFTDNRQETWKPAGLFRF